MAPSFHDSETTDVEAQPSQTTRLGHFQLLLDQGRITPEVLNHKFPGDGTHESPYLVDFLQDDAGNPMTYSRSFKWVTVVMQAFATLSVSFASSAFTGGLPEITKMFHVSDEVAILGVSLFVVGFAVGPLLWAPLSEMYGRQRLFFISYMALAAFSAGAAGSQNIQTLIILRFLAGTFGSSPLTNAGGVIADTFTANERGLATSIFALAPFLGPALGPIAGGFLGEAAGWRWVQGMIAAYTGVVWIMSSLLYTETYAPRILEQRAAALSKRTGHVYISKMLAGEAKTTVAQKFGVALSRPWVLLFKEPIVLLSALYMAIIYGTLYMCFAAFPIVFQQTRGWSAGIGGLAFCGIAVGMVLAVIGTFLDNNYRYQRETEKHNGAAPPEARMPPAIVGSILLPVGLFWFAWTNSPSVNFMVPIIGSAFFAAGIVLLFLAMMNYLVDSYVIYAASCLAANSVLRSLFGAAFPLFTNYMYESLGIHWASSIPAFLALACVPCPWLFWKYGHKIRMKCQFAAEAAAFLAKMRAKVDDPPPTPVNRETKETPETEKAQSGSP